MTPWMSKEEVKVLIDMGPNPQHSAQILEKLNVIRKLVEDKMTIEGELRLGHNGNGPKRRERGVMDEKERSSICDSFVMACRMTRMKLRCWKI